MLPRTVGWGFPQIMEPRQIPIDLLDLDSLALNLPSQVTLGCVKVDNQASKAVTVNIFRTN